MSRTRSKDEESAMRKNFCVGININYIYYGKNYSK